MLSSSCISECLIPTSEVTTEIDDQQNGIQQYAKDAHSFASEQCCEDGSWNTRNVPRNWRVMAIRCADDVITLACQSGVDLRCQHHNVSNAKHRDILSNACDRGVCGSSRDPCQLLREDRHRSPIDHRQ